jgi:hypothetical protein
LRRKNLKRVALTAPNARGKPSPILASKIKTNYFMTKFSEQINIYHHQAYKEEEEEEEEEEEDRRRRKRRRRRGVRGRMRR